MKTESENHFSIKSTKFNFHLPVVFIVQTSLSFLQFLKFDSGLEFECTVNQDMTLSFIFFLCLQ